MTTKTAPADAFVSSIKTKVRKRQEEWANKPKLERTKTITAALATASVLAATADTAWGAHVTTQSMLRQGWNKALPMKTEAKFFPFMSECIANQPCLSAFLGLKRGGMMANSHPWLWLVAFTALFGASAARKAGGIALKDQLPGYARFAERDDAPLQKYIKPFPSKDNDIRRGYLGLLEDGTIMKAPMFLRCSHACIMGGPGARKSTGYHKPNMVMDALEGSSAVVIDLKYPDPKGGFFDMAPAFHALKRDIQIFTPFDQNTMRLNILETATNIDAALMLSSMIIPSKENEGGGAFYRNIERTVLGALLLAIAMSDKPSMREVYRKIIAGPSALKEFILKHPDETVRETAAAMLEIKLDQLTGIIASLQNQLAIFNNKALARATTPKVGQNLDLKGCFRKPTLLYVGINQGDILGGTGQTLLQLVKRSIDQAMFDVSRENGGRLPIHTVFYLDEFANLGPLPNIQQNFATMRSYNVSYQVTLQNRAQGEELYGTTGFKSFFENNLQFQIVFPAFLKMSDAELYSDNMGYTSYIERGQSVSEARNPFQRAGSGTRSESTKISKRLLVTPDEMLDWAPEVAIIFMIGVRPIKAFMPRLDEESITITDSKGRKRKLMNPLHRYWSELGLGEDPAIFMAEFLRKRDAALGVKSEGEEDEAEFNPIPAEERFRTWIMQLVTYGAYVSPYRTQGRAIVFHKDLPEELHTPSDLAEFTEKGWVNPEADRFKIVKKGADILGMTSIFAALCDLEFKGGLRLWIHRHASGLIGHPNAQAEQQSSDDVLGYYEEEAVTITRQAAEEIFRNVPAERFEPFRVTRGGRTYYRIPLGSDESLLAIWGKANDSGKPMGINNDIAPKFSPGSENDIEQQLKGDGTSARHPHPAEASSEQTGSGEARSNQPRSGSTGAASASTSVSRPAAPRPAAPRPGTPGSAPQTKGPKSSPEGESPTASSKAPGVPGKPAAGLSDGAPKPRPTGAGTPSAAEGRSGQKPGETKPKRGIGRR